MCRTERAVTEAAPAKSATAEELVLRSCLPDGRLVADGFARGCEVERGGSQRASRSCTFLRAAQTARY